MPLLITYVHRIDVEKFYENIGSENIFIKSGDLHSSEALKEGKTYAGKIDKVSIENIDSVKGKHITAIASEDPFDDETPKLKLHFYGEYAKKMKLLSDDLFAVTNATVNLNDKSINDPRLYPHSIVIEKQNSEENDPTLWIMTTALPGMQRTEEYEYTTSPELHENLGRKINFVGIVIRANEIKQTKGTSFHYGIIVIDAGSTSMENQKDVAVNIFINTHNDVPNILHGDIIRLHRAKVEKYNNKLNLTLFSEKDYALWSSEMDGTTEAVTAAKTYSFHAFDRSCIHAFRIWWNHIYPLRNEYQRLVADGKTFDFRPLSSIRADKYISVICQVTDRIEINDDVTLLRLWDGTKPPEKLYKHPIDTKSSGEEQNWQIPRDYVVDVITKDEFSQQTNKININNIIILKHLRCVSNDDSSWTLEMSNDSFTVTKICLFEERKATYYRNLFKMKLKEIRKNGSTSPDEQLFQTIF